MFTGIIESLGKITDLKVDRGNIDFTIESDISKELKVDQSVSHNGVCLTVTETNNNTHTVTAVKETLDKSSLANFSVNDGSWIYRFEFDISNEMLLIEKGSICINGVSLTVFDILENTFKVTIIPYTYENTSFKTLNEGDIVNIEFDMIGKYLARFNK